jgi:integrase
LWSQGALDELPRNFGDRRRLSRPAPEIQTYSDAEVQALLGAARGQHKLHVFLGLNCGFHVIDVGTLARSEVDLAAGVISRRRHKTRRQRHAPLVRYPLWAATLSLLRDHIEKRGTLALLTPAGGAWARTALVGERTKECKALADYHAALCGRLGLSGGFKTLRKTSASKLRSHAVYRDLRDHFLGESPASVGDRHYSQVPQALFEEAVRWLGTTYGLA